MDILSYLESMRKYIVKVSKEYKGRNCLTKNWIPPEEIFTSLLIVEILKLDDKYRDDIITVMNAFHDVNNRKFDTDDINKCKNISFKNKND